MDTEPAWCVQGAHEGVLTEVAGPYVLRTMQGIRYPDLPPGGRSEAGNNQHHNHIKG